MREMTQQIVFIDSIVTDKDRFLSQYRLSSETGTLTTTGQFFGKSISGHAFLNEMGNKVYFSRTDGSGFHRLYTSDKLGTVWGEGTPLKGLSEGITDADYPFMMNDGITFYFAALSQRQFPQAREHRHALQLRSQRLHVCGRRREWHRLFRQRPSPV